MFAETVDFPPTLAGRDREHLAKVRLRNGVGGGARRTRPGPRPRFPRPPPRYTLIVTAVTQHRLTAFRTSRTSCRDPPGQ